jgi:peptidoglycan biosynthesis protein MviN/MurJ (putative lipid II flippase)
MSDTNAYVITTPLETVDDVPDAPVPDPRPRIRWPAIVWGLIVTTVTATALYVRADVARSTDFATWINGLTPVSIGLLAILAVGLFVLIVALLSVVKREQIKRRALELQGPPIG